MRRLLAAAWLALAAAGGGGGERPAAASATADDWRRIATPADRARLRGWRRAWIDALGQARTTPDGAAAIAADPPLFDADRALTDARPPAGDYRCRTVKLGRRGAVGLGYVAYGWFRCRVGAGRPATFAKLDGSQRPVGLLYADTDSRMLMLGSLALGDEARAMGYGRDRDRDVLGVVERIGARRWRIAFPYPAYESVLDVLELLPA